MATFIDQARVVFPGVGIAATGIRFANGKVSAVGDDVGQAGDTVIDAHGQLLTPGLIDLHVHGIGRLSFERGPEELLAAAGCFAAFGTTTVLPTVLPRLGEGLMDRLAALAGALEAVENVHMPGLHLEGPFMALPGAGCDVVPGDVSLLGELLAACERRVAVMSLSPETPGILPVIELLVERGVVPFVTHTQASCAEARAAIAAGARHATHFYDVFPPPPEVDPGVRPPGVVEAFLADGSATVDFIADGCHVDPMVIELAVRTKGAPRVAVITDGNIGAGLPPGIHETPWGSSVEAHPERGVRVVSPDRGRVGGLAGSALTMNLAMRNVLKWLDLPPEHVWAMGTSTPAAVAHLTGKGALSVGGDADAVLWKDDLTPAAVWVAGRRVPCEPPA